MSVFVFHESSKKSVPELLMKAAETALFNQWGIGNSTANIGPMMMMDQRRLKTEPGTRGRLSSRSASTAVLFVPRGAVILPLRRSFDDIGHGALRSPYGRLRSSLDEYSQT